jgi:DNA polymerase-3 subunit epsilon
MNFKRDLLLIDIEATGLDAARHEIIQLAGVLLDKKTLKEKEAFSSFIRPRFWQRRDPESMAVNKIAFKVVKEAPDLKSTLEKFNKTFGSDVILSYYVGVMDITFLQAAYSRAKQKWPFDYHTFNIWSLFYPFLAKKNKLKNKKDFSGFNLEDLIKKFKLKLDKSQLHDALVDCRVEAEVLRMVVLDL